MSEVPSACPSSDPSAGEPGRAAACEGCPSRDQCASAARKDPEKLRRISEVVAGWTNRIMVMSGKGGVGKSTISALLALGLSADSGCSVGLLDGDLCGPNIPHLLKATDQYIYQTVQGWSPVMVKENLSIVSSQYFIEPSDALIWRGPKKNGFLEQLVLDVNWGDLDFMVVDTPPGTSDEHITLAEIIRPTGVILVSHAHRLSTDDVKRQIQFCRRLRLRLIGCVINCASTICDRCQSRVAVFRQSTDFDRFKQFAQCELLYIDHLPLLVQDLTDLITESDKSAELIAQTERLVQWTKNAVDDLPQ